MEWRIKTKISSKKPKWIIAFTVIHSTTTKDWYFDSCCSRHMIGNQVFFSELKECTSGHVTFRDGDRGRILGKGNILKYDIPKL